MCIQKLRHAEGLNLGAKCIGLILNFKVPLMRDGIVRIVNEL